MDTSTNSLVSKVWSFCKTLRDDGVSYGDYLNNSQQDQSGHFMDQPDELAEEIIENLEAGLESFKTILNEVASSR